jgi:hypothetical protein
MSATVAAAGVLGVLATRGATPSTTAAAASHPTPAELLARVEAVVAERNRHVGDEAQRFIADGWQMVDAEPPEARLVDLDPALLRDGREAELRVQLASTVAAPRHARNLGRIARLAPSAATREAAVLALGRIDADLAREELIALLTEDVLAPDDVARRQVAALLRPRDLDDGAAARFAGLLDHPKLTVAEKQQLAFNLALVGLRDGMTLAEPVLASLSPAARRLLDDMTALGSRSFLAHRHHHP